MCVIVLSKLERGAAGSTLVLATKQAGIAVESVGVYPHSAPTSTGNPGACNRHFGEQPWGVWRQGSPSALGGILPLALGGGYQLQGLSTVSPGRCPHNR